MKNIYFYLTLLMIFPLHIGCAQEIFPVKSMDGKIQLSLPHGWKEEKPKSSANVYKFVDADRRLFVYVTRGNKIDYKTLSDFARLTIKALEGEGFSISKNEGPIQIRFNEHPALRYKVYGSIDGANYLYLQIYIELGNHYYSVSGASLVSILESNKLLIEKILESFREN